MRSLRSAFASPFTPKARAMSRLVTRAGGLSPLGAGRAADEGDQLVARRQSARLAARDGWRGGAPGRRGFSQRVGLA